MPTLKAFIAAGAAAAFTASTVGLVTWHSFANVFSPHTGKLLVLAIFLTALYRWWHAGREAVSDIVSITAPGSLPSSTRVARPRLRIPSFKLPKLSPLAARLSSSVKNFVTRERRAWRPIRARIRVPRVARVMQVVSPTRTVRRWTTTRIQSVRRRWLAFVTRELHFEKRFHLKFTLRLTRPVMHTETVVPRLEVESGD